MKQRIWNCIGAGLSRLCAISALSLAMAPAVADKPADRLAASTGWQKMENLAPVVRGVDGKPHTASCSAYPGTDPRFNFWSKRGNSRNLVVYFEGGGACWNDYTCTFPQADLPAEVPQFFTPTLYPDINPALYDGIFNASQARNPVKDWSFVYIPNCTGDVHIGSATRKYFNAGHPVFPLPNDFKIQHRGFDNFMVVLDWMKKNIHEPDRILVAGSSAGGYGASANFPWVQKVYPNSRMAVLADAAQGINTRNFDVSNPGRESWKPQVAPWVFGNDPKRIASPDILRIAAAAYPNTRVAQFTTQFDEVQIGYYSAVKTFHPPGGTCPNPALDWNTQMLANLQATAASRPNYRHYVAAGQYHTILSSAQFYTEASAGVSFRDWFDDMLVRGDPEDQGRNDHLGAGQAKWRNAACPGCLLSIPCQ